MTPSTESLVRWADNLFIEYEEQVSEALTIIMLEISDLAANLTGGSIALIVGLVGVYLAANFLLTRMHSQRFPNRSA